LVECASHFCYNSHCAAIIPLGGICDPTNDGCGVSAPCRPGGLFECNAGLVCNADGSCVSPPQPFLPCTSDSQCASTGGTCSCDLLFGGSMVCDGPENYIFPTFCQSVVPAYYQCLTENQCAESVLVYPGTCAATNCGAHFACASACFQSIPRNQAYGQLFGSFPSYSSCPNPIAPVSSGLHLSPIFSGLLVVFVFVGLSRCF